MKYIVFVIAGLFLGGASNSGWGFFVSALLGFMAAWVLDLSQKVTRLETKLKKGLLDENSRGTLQKPFVENAAEDIKPGEEDAIFEFTDISSSNDETVAAASIKRSDDSELTQKGESLEGSELNDLNIDQDSKTETAVNYAHKKIDDSQTSASESVAMAQVTNQDNKPLMTDKSQRPSAFDSAVKKGIKTIKAWIIGYFTGSNSLVRTGMLVLFVGVAFLLKYVAERTTVPIEARYAGIVIGSIVLLGLGWWLRRKRAGFALSLQGGGIGLLYLTLFAAMRLHQLLPPAVVLLCLVGIVALSALLAVLQDAMALAVIGVIGGFAAPILTSTGSGSHVQLFGYYLILNLSIFGIAWFKSWRLLNVIGFFATFAVGSVWGVKYYQPENFATVEPFLIAHFLLYVVIAVLFAFKQPPKLKGINDGTLIFGTPIVAFSLQAALVKDMSYGLAYSALILAVLYVLLAYLIKLLHRPFFKDLIESFIALGVGFATLAIPLGFDGRVTSAMWVAEASALVWVGIRQQRLLPRFSGYGLAALGCLAFFAEKPGGNEVLPFLNADFVGVLIVVAATAFMGLYARRHQTRLLSLESLWIPRLMLISAVTWWTSGGLVEFAKHFPQQRYLWHQLWLLVSTLGLIYGSRRLAYPMLLILSMVLNALMLPLLLWLSAAQPTDMLILNVSFLGMFVAAIFYVSMSIFWPKLLAESGFNNAEKAGQLMARFFLSIGVMVWLWAMIREIHRFFPMQQLLWNEAMMSITAGLLLSVGHKKPLSDFKWAALSVVVVMLLPLYLTFGSHDWPIPVFSADSLPLINVTFPAILVYFLSHFFMANYWRKSAPVASTYKLLIVRSLLVLALISWVMNGFYEADKFLDLPGLLTVIIIFFSASFILFIWLAHYLKWPDLHRIKYVMTPLLLLIALLTPVFQDFHQALGLVAWLLAFAVNYWILKLYAKRLQNIDYYHMFSLWLLSYIAVYEFVTLIGVQIGRDNIWYAASFSAMLLAVSSLLFMLRNKLKWPLMAHPKAYFKWALPMMVLVLWISVLYLNLKDPGSLKGVWYVPVINIIDILGLLSLLLAMKMHQDNSSVFFEVGQKVKYVLLAATGFLMLNATMLRCFHYWYDIDYQWIDLMTSFRVQTAFSILWAATAVTLMVMAARKKIRALWLLGLALMIVVVAKLFLVDMSASGSIERIVAFLSVGVLLSLVGYFSPLPPDNKSKNTQTETGERHEI